MLRAGLLRPCLLWPYLLWPCLLWPYLLWPYLLWPCLLWPCLLWPCLLWFGLLWFGLREVDEGGGKAVRITLDHDVLTGLGQVAVKHAPSKCSLVVSRVSRVSTGRGAAS